MANETKGAALRSVLRTSSPITPFEVNLLALLRRLMMLCFSFVRSVCRFPDVRAARYLQPIAIAPGKRRDDRPNFLQQL